jgi:hypothetical protein
MTRYQRTLIDAALSSGLKPAQVAKSLKLPLATIRAVVKQRKS